MTRPWRMVRLDARRWGVVLSAAGIVLATRSSLLAAALGVELVAVAFWVWARAADDAGEQVPRWEWLRRPATALWLAVAIHAIVPNMSHTLPGQEPQWFNWLEAIAVLWACFELLAALPLARPYSDLPGPLLDVRPWLPVMLPAVGFTVLWTQAPHWIGVPMVRQASIPLLLMTALLGVLRAFARRHWTATLRWLAVADCALAGVLVATRALPPLVSLMLWMAALGAHAALLAGELRGAIPRRGRTNVRLWRAASWAAWAALSLPVLAAAAKVVHGGWRTAFQLSASIPVALGAWVVIARMNEAPERRRMQRRSFQIMMSQALAVVVLAAGPAALVLAWVTGTLPSLPISAFTPAVLAGGAAVLMRRYPEAPALESFATRLRSAPGIAGTLYRLVVGFERRLMVALMRIVRVMISPFEDLHTGDAQEYLLFLIGVGVLALVLPLLT